MAEGKEKYQPTPEEVGHAKDMLSNEEASSSEQRVKEVLSSDEKNKEFYDREIRELTKLWNAKKDFPEPETMWLKAEVYLHHNLYGTIDSEQSFKIAIRNMGRDRDSAIKSAEKHKNEQ